MNKKFKAVFAVLLSVVLALSLLPAAFAEGAHVHTDENSDGYCDECYTFFACSVTVYAEDTVTKLFETGSLLADCLAGVISGQGAQASDFLYVDGKSVKDTDTVPDTLETLSIYAVVVHGEEAPSCEEYGHKAYYENTLTGLFYEDDELTVCIGDEYDLDDWIKDEALGSTGAPLGHSFVCADNAPSGHICTREGCKYHNVPDMHDLNNEGTACNECGAVCYSACDTDPTCSDFFCFCAPFVNDGEPLDKIWYYVGEDVTLDDVLTISGSDVRLLIEDGVTFDASAGILTMPACYFEVYYRSRGEGSGTFIGGPEYKCYDETENEYYAEHTDANSDLVCDVCGVSECEHDYDDIVCTYDWADDYSSCYGKATCQKCGKVLTEGYGDVVYNKTVSPTCQKKAAGRYTAYFDGYIDYTKTEVIEGDFGAHTFNENFFCTKCGKSDVLGAKNVYNKKIDILEENNEDAATAEYLEEIRAQVNAAGTVTGVRDAYAGAEIPDDLLAALALSEYKSKTLDNLIAYAKRTSYEKGSVKFAKECAALIDAAEDLDGVDAAYDEAVDALDEIITLKNECVEKLAGLFYSEDMTAEGQAELLKIYDEIIAAVHADDVTQISDTMEERAYNAVLLPLKEAACADIDALAGETPSADMQTVAANAKEAVMAAKTSEELESAKQAGLSAVSAQLEKEAEEAAAAEAAAKALAEAKEKAIADITAKAAEYGDKASEILTEAIEKINAAETPEEVNAEAGKAAESLAALSDDTGDTDDDKPGDEKPSGIKGFFAKIRDFFIRLWNAIKSLFTK